MLEKELSIVKDYSEWLLSQGIPSEIVNYVRLLTLLALLLLVISGINLVAKKIIVRGAHKLFSVTKNSWDDAFVQEGVFTRLSLLFPALFASWVVNFIFEDFPNAISWVDDFIEIYVIYILMQVAVATFKSLEHSFYKMDKFKDKPLESYFQLALLITYFIGGIFIVSVLIGQTPMYLLSAFGAMTAIGMLVFKDTILGFVASIQISANDMLRVNDWLEMKKYGADGNVTSITLNTVKVQNWDTTVTTIPTYALVSDSFKNWRNMQDLGARRIKRAVYIRPNSIKFITNEMLDTYRSFQLLETYIDETQKEINAYNAEIKANKKQLVNGRQLTNIGVFRKYVELYLRNHPQIRQDLTLMIRQLQSNQYGLPLEIYCFATTTDWVAYEGIQSDILDHVLASAEAFGLQIYELNGAVAETH